LGKIVSGIDEAGRGGVFGPLIVAGISLFESDLKELEEKGLKDSKLFTGSTGRKKRDKLALEIQDSAVNQIVKEIPSEEIDTTLAKRPSDNLNLLEIRNFYQIIKDLKSNRIFVDNLKSPKYTVGELRKLVHQSKDNYELVITSRNTDEYSVYLSKEDQTKIRIVIATKADKRYSIVAASSILAKYTRDKRLREIEQEFHLPSLSLGQGYPNSTDKHVIKFLEDYQKQIKARTLPFIRYNWEWAALQTILSQPEKTLDEFF
jgi:ribonuclease HII